MSFQQFLVKGTKLYSKTNHAILKAFRKVHVHYRNNSTKTNAKPILHKVIISKSKNIFENLALEEWLYRNADFQECSYLLMWRNHETIVIGRHQNVWKEANIPLLYAADVCLARRYSGGGAVYHDLGNVNFSFLTSRKHYNRKQNLNTVVDALHNRWALDLHVDTRDCIMWNNLYKVSGTASRYDSKKAYHHFTLLLHVDEHNLNTLLQPSLSGIVGNPATPSVPASIINLKEIDDHLTFDNVVECVGQYFLLKGISSQQTTNIEYVEPAEATCYPGIHEIISQLKDWTWVYGKTPTFTLSRKFFIQLPTSSISLEMKSQIKEGIIMNLHFTTSPFQPSLEQIVTRVRDRVESQRLCHQQLESCFKELQATFDESKIQEFHMNNQIITCVRKLFLE